MIIIVITELKFKSLLAPDTIVVHKLPVLSLRFLALRLKRVNEDIR